MLIGSAGRLRICVFHPELQATVCDWCDRVGVVFVVGGHLHSPPGVLVRPIRYEYFPRVTAGTRRVAIRKCACTTISVPHTASFLKIGVCSFSQVRVVHLEAFLAVFDFLCTCRCHGVHYPNCMVISPTHVTEELTDESAFMTIFVPHVEVFTVVTFVCLSELSGRFRGWGCGVGWCLEGSLPFPFADLSCHLVMFGRCCSLPAVVA